MGQPLPPSRFRRVAKWVGVALCVLILAVWAVSTLVDVGYRWRSCSIGFGEGGAAVVVYDREWFDWLQLNNGPRRGWWVHRHYFTLGDLTSNMITLKERGVSVGRGVHFPLWIPLALSVLPTSILWYRDRRKPKPGYCVKCGYDLRASKKACSECGTGIIAEPI